MPYRRWPAAGRRYDRSENRSASMALPAGDMKEVTDIPLPNIADEAHADRNSERVHNPSFLSLLKNRITLEEIILLGLIILILDEGVEDEFILIMLIYVLLN